MQQLTFYAPIEKTDDEERMVYGYASTEALDSQGEIVKVDALKDAISDYMKFANIREMHQPSAVGKAKKASIDSKGLYLAAKVVDDAAWKKVKEGVYNGFSIGGHVNQMVDNTITNLGLSEISLVDRPANPEAVFDVWKSADVTKRQFTAEQRRDLASKGKAMPDGSYPIENEEDVENAVRSFGRGGSKPAVKAHIVRRAKALGVTDKLPDDWQGATKEEKSEKVEMKKGSGDAMDLTSHVRNLEAMLANEQAEGDEPTSAALTAAIKSLKEAASSELLENDEDDNGDRSDAMYRSDEATNLMKVVDAKIALGNMPTEEEVDQLLKAQEIPVNEKTRGVMKFELAGLIVKAVEARMQGKMNADAAKKKAEKVLNDADVQEATTVGERNHFKKILGLVDKAEEQIKKTTLTEEAENTNEEDIDADDANGVKEAEDSHMATDGNAAVSTDLVSLQAVVALLSSKNMGGALTEDEMNALREGNSAGSNRSGKDQVDAEDAAEADNDKDDVLDGKGSEVVAAATISNLKKLQKAETLVLRQELTELKTELQKLAKTVMPIKVKTAYTTVEKVEKTNGDTDLLAKAEARADELNKLMAQDPNNAVLHQEAGLLSAQIMKLRREKRG